MDEHAASLILQGANLALYASSLVMRIYSSERNALSIHEAVIPPLGRCKDSVVGVIVLDGYPMRLRVVFECHLGGFGFIAVLTLHEMHIAEIRVMIHEYAGVAVPLPGEKAAHLCNYTWSC